MIKLKGCPKCKGDVILDKDIHGWYEQCLQCGYLADKTDSSRSEVSKKQEDRELVQAR